MPCSTNEIAFFSTGRVLSLFFFLVVTSLVNDIMTGSSYARSYRFAFSCYSFSSFFLNFRVSSSFPFCITTLSLPVLFVYSRACKRLVINRSAWVPFFFFATVFDDEYCFIFRVAYQLMLELVLIVWCSATEYPK